MLMITYQIAGQGVVLKVEGRLAGPWTDELVSLWAQTAPRLSFNRLSIDLRDLTYADIRGMDVLRTIYAQTQANLIADTPWTRHLAEEIKSGKQGPVELGGELKFGPPPGTEITLRIPRESEMPVLSAVEASDARVPAFGGLNQFHFQHTKE